MRKQTIYTNRFDLSVALDELLANIEPNDRQLLEYYYGSSIDFNTLNNDKMYAALDKLDAKTTKSSIARYTRSILPYFATNYGYTCNQRIMTAFQKGALK